MVDRVWRTKNHANAFRTVWHSQANTVVEIESDKPAEMAVPAFPTARKNNCSHRFSCEFNEPSLAGRPKTAICRVSEKIQTAYVCEYTARPEFFHFLASHHFGTACIF
jgi:hypothetical protein